MIDPVDILTLGVSLLGLGLAMVVGAGLIRKLKALLKSRQD